MKEPIFVETIKIENGIIHNLDAHNERMQKTAFLYYGTKPVLRAEMLANQPSDLSGSRIKCRVLYSSDIISIEFHAYRLREIKSLMLVEDNEVSYKDKAIDRNVLNILFEQRKEADDIIIVKNGNVTDSSFSNLVFESLDGELFTPTTYLLAGTKRKHLLETGIIKEQKITIDNITTYKKVYLINAMIDIEDNVSIPISSIILK